MSFTIPPPAPRFPPQGGGGQTNVPPGNVIAGRGPASTSPVRYYPTFQKGTPSDIIFFAKNVHQAVYDLQKSGQVQAAQAQLHATIASGAITAIDILPTSPAQASTLASGSNISGGTYSSAPQLIAVGGGGTGAQLTAVLDQNGGIKSVTVVNGGSGYTSPPAIVVVGD